MPTEPNRPQMHYMHLPIQRSRRTLAGLGLCIGAACISLFGAEPAKANGTTFYGIDNNNNIWEVNPITKTNVKVNSTGLTTFEGSNGIAYDTVRDHLFFFYNPISRGPGQIYDLRFWNRKSTGTGSLQTIDLGSVTDIPANAAYYNNSLWYFGGGNTDLEELTILYQLSFTYNASEDAIIGQSLSSYDLSTYSTPTYEPGIYGDIAINTKTGFLYGSTIQGNYYSIDLNKLGDTSNAIYTDLGTINSLQGSTPAQAPTGLQLSFNADYSKLFGTRFCNGAIVCTGYTLDGQPITPAAGDGLFFEITDYAIGDSSRVRNLTDADLLYYATPGFRDLGGATTNELVPVPGPVPVLAAGTAFGWSRRMRRKLRSPVRG